MRTLSALSLVSLLLLGRTLHAGQPAKLKPDTQRGRELYLASCQSCHGARGLGDGPISAMLPSPPLAGRLPEGGRAAAVDIILHGRGDMPAFALTVPAVDARRVLLWLGTLDPETGLSQSGEDEEPEDEGEGSEDEEVGGGG